MVGTAVLDAVALVHQQIDVQGHAHMTGKGHFTNRGPQTAVASIVVGQQQALLT